MRYSLLRDTGLVCHPITRLFLMAATILFPIGPISLCGQSLPAGYPIQGTFLNFYRNLSPELWALEFQRMNAAGINSIFVVSVGQLQASSTPPLSCSLGAASYRDPSGYAISPSGLIFPSNSVSLTQRPTVDLLEMILELADARQMNVYLGSLQTATDWSDSTEFCALRSYNQQIASEILQRYGHHPSLKGWYFTQELWMNWLKYYGELHNTDASGYYGTNLIAQWITDMKALDSTKLTTAAVVVKETGTPGGMPGLTAAELQQWTTSFLETTHLDILMPQDGAGAGAGAPPLADLPAYYGAMAAASAAAGTNTSLWSTLETFTASSDPTLSGEQYPPTNSISRIQTQVNNVRPYVSGYVSWIFGDDMSPQATYYPVEASNLYRQYQRTFQPQLFPNDDVIPISTYWYPTQQPDPAYPDSASAPKLSDGTGGGYNDASLTSWVGFSNLNYVPTTTQVVADLGTTKTIHSVQALTQSWMTSGILHPSQMLVQVSQDNLHWSPFGTTASFPSDTQDFAVMWGEVDNSASARYVRCTFIYSQWLFLAELEVIGPR